MANEWLDQAKENIKATDTPFPSAERSEEVESVL